jgi:hypothetical protein
MDKALLVGINRYPAAPLRGCVNDVTDLAQFLVDSCGFAMGDVRLIADERATKTEITDRLNWLVDGAKPGDRLFFHFSGHGTQMATRDHQGEIDGLDEVICPVDFDWTDDHVIRDKDFRRVFGSIPEGCQFVWVSDSCHSGDLERVEGAHAPDRIGTDGEHGDVLGLQVRPDIGGLGVRRPFQRRADVLPPEGAVGRGWTPGRARGRAGGREEGNRRGRKVSADPWSRRLTSAHQAAFSFKELGENMANLCTGLVTLQLKDVDVASRDTLAKVIQSLTPAIVENIMVAAVADRARGCTVSGSVSSAGGGSASGTITCTF